MKKKWIAGLISVFMLVSMCACGRQDSIAAVNMVPSDVTYPEAVDFDDFDAKREVRAQNPVDKVFLNAFTSFSYETTSAVLCRAKGNVNYSPLSLYYALSLAGSGASGKTQSQIFDLLGISDAEELSEQCGNLYRQLYMDHSISKLKIANSLWLDRDTVFNGDFEQNAAKNFYASLKTVDFTDEDTGKMMGQWISDNTNGNLTPVFKTDPNQIFSIINTVYFYDEWIDRFNKDETTEDVFHAPGSDVTAYYMNKTLGSARFVKGDGFTRSSLGLKGAGGMVFILPDKGVNVSELLSSSKNVKELFEGGESGYGEVVWQIPKFSFDTKNELAVTLKTLGIQDAFEEKADFSGITVEPAFITSLIQETHIAIDENGVEASAFTEIQYAGAALPESRAEMILDRPFLYGITTGNGTLLFVGVCNNPTVQ